MEIAHIYIKEHKSINNLNIPINGQFECFHSGDNLTLRKRTNYFSTYYNDITISVLIGKNGTGKTTILSFLETLILANDSSGMVVFYCKQQHTFYICNINCRQLADINIVSNENESPASYKNVLNCKDFIEQHKLKLVHINNISPEQTELIITKNKSTSSIINLSLKSNTKNQKTKRDYFSKLLAYFNDWFIRESFQENIYFELKIDPAPSRIMLRAMGSGIAIQKKTNTIEIIEKCSYTLREIQLFNNKILSDNLIGMNVLSILSQLSKLTHSDIEYQNKALFYFIYIFAILKEKYNDMGYHNLLHETIRSLEFRENWSEINNEEAEHYSFFEKIDISLLNKTLELNLQQLFSLSALIVDHGLEYTKVNNNTCRLEDYSLIIKISALVNKLPNEISNNIKLGWCGVSTGELAYSHIFSETFNYLINQESSSADNNIIIIDEVDLYLHPEWQRTFLSRFVSLIHYCHQVKGCSTPQIILTTHSPIITGDFLPKDIISLYKEKDEYNDEHIVIKPSIGFGTSISDLYLAGMHLTAIFGEHSKKYIDGILLRAEKDKLTEFDKLLIDQISDKHIRNYFLKL